MCGASPLFWPFGAEVPGPERSTLAYEGRDEQPLDDDPVGSSADERAGLEEELRVQRSEEELRASVRERGAGQVNVKKSVRTEREVVRVPKRRQEVDIERVPVEGEAREARGATEADIGEDEVVVQVFEEEVVVTKRVVLKEEIRLRKRVVEDEEAVEVDLRKEEVEVDDQTKYGAGGALWELPIQAPPARED
jgi:uncharacterized protein (TIGR02271 family)